MFISQELGSRIEQAEWCTVGLFAEVCLSNLHKGTQNKNLCKDPETGAGNCQSLFQACSKDLWDVSLETQHTAGVETLTDGVQEKDMKEPRAALAIDSNYREIWVWWHRSVILGYLGGWSRRFPSWRIALATYQNLVPKQTYKQQQKGGYSLVIKCLSSMCCPMHRKTNNQTKPQPTNQNQMANLLEQGS